MYACVHFHGLTLVQVWDRDFLKPDDLLGQMEVPIKTIVTWTQVGREGGGEMGQA